LREGEILDEMTRARGKEGKSQKKEKKKKKKISLSI